MRNKLNHTNRIIAEGYQPTEDDLFYSYAPTIGLDGHMIRLGKVKYDLLELPGHRIFRRKWSDYFRFTTVVVFLIDLSELCNSAFYTGHLKNKTISVYEQVVQHDLLSRSGFILLFNKKDVFDDMACGFDFKKWSTNLRSGQDALSSYRMLFLSASPPKRSYTHVVSLLNAPKLGFTLADSLQRIFKYNSQNAIIS
ncbi:hypothetical protein DICVIV_04655 [Dictyocaulus viviparus]|uniref:G-protein alpha subunit n=1 Tax=Dictyocaulus viviparus TaxID=29172 RepID=A0A0D8XXL4_DICVI|nr:hypothetical protein DICVIV_04655 [Dictyocaulus viviparus]